jgi:hypothetical protein
VWNSLRPRLLGVENILITRRFESERQTKLQGTGQNIYTRSCNQLRNDFSLWTQQKMEAASTVTQVRLGLCLLVQQTNVWQRRRRSANLPYFDTRVCYPPSLLIGRLPALFSVKRTRKIGVIWKIVLSSKLLSVRTWMYDLLQVKLPSLKRLTAYHFTYFRA